MTLRLELGERTSACGLIVRIEWRNNEFRKYVSKDREEWRDEVTKQKYRIKHHIPVLIRIGGGKLKLVDDQND